MKKFLIAFYLLHFTTIAFCEPIITSHIAKNGNDIILYNDLPESFPELPELSHFDEELLYYTKEGPVECKIGISLDGDNVTILINTSGTDIEKELIDKDYGSFLDLQIIQSYFISLNRWFFKNTQFYDKEIVDSMSELNYFYTFVYEKMNNSITFFGSIGQIYSNTFGTYINDMLIENPIIVEFNGYNGEVNGVKNDGGPIIHLGQPYNHITGEYNTFYLVYKLFEVDKALKGIPPLE